MRRGWVGARSACAAKLYDNRMRAARRKGLQSPGARVNAQRHIKKFTVHQVRTIVALVGGIHISSRQRQHCRAGAVPHQPCGIGLQGGAQRGSRGLVSGCRPEGGCRPRGLPFCTTVM